MDVAGNVLTGRTITWSSSATTVAAVNGVTGLVTAVAVGAATISATSEGKTGTAVLTVIPDVLRCAGAPQLGCGLGLDQFSLIPPGTFQMGSAVWAPVVGEGVIPEHAVTISRAFYMQKTEVTQGQWQAVMGSNPSYFSNCALSCPVEYVSYNDIRAFIERLTASTGFTYRLPTEAEWEYAARAGTTGDIYGTLDGIAWYLDNAGGGTHPVAGKQANAWGLYDTIGNVSEWVNDWTGPYSPGSAIDPTGPAGGTRRVSRGASWSTLSWMTFGAMRYGSDPSSRVSQGGFRLARSP
jgi:formylglycine-generating enzyme required for sulfatase activity